MIHTPNPEPRRPKGRRLTDDERREIINLTRESCEGTLLEIDKTLQLCSRGRRNVSAGVSVVGSVEVSATVAGIQALAGLPGVKCIMESQGIHSL